MAVARILFLARYRIPHACVSLQFDHNLQGIDYTVIASPVPKDELWAIFHNHNIDTSCFEYVNDDVIYQNYPEVNNWVFKDDYRGWWLRQQAIKLSFLDHLKIDVMLMQDPDTFLIEPYRCYQDGVLNFHALMDTTQGSYNGVFESITGLPRQSPHCFVTEFVPVRYSDWVQLRKHLAEKWPNKLWLDAIIDAVPGMPTVPPWGTGNIIKWFSEYEFVGNWAVHCGNVTYQPHLRYEYSTLDQMTAWSAEHNAIADAIPDLRLSLQIENGRVVDFDYHMSLIKEKLK
jgi:hypothetical protein